MVVYIELPYNGKKIVVVYIHDARIKILGSGIYESDKKFQCYNAPYTVDV